VGSWVASLNWEGIFIDSLLSNAMNGNMEGERRKLEEGG